MARRFRLVVFDLDGTLVKAKSSWITIHEHFETTKNARLNLELYNENRITYKEFMRRDILLWPRRLPISKITSILMENLSLNDDSHRVISEIKKRGYQTAIVSAGLDVLANKVKELLGVDFCIANGLETDENGFLSGEGIMRVELSHKDIALLQILRQAGLTSQECIAVGDSMYDATLLQCAGLSVAISDDDYLKKFASVTIDRLSELLVYV